MADEADQSDGAEPEAEAKAEVITKTVEKVEHVWDPMLAAAAPATRQCLKRIKKDLRDLFGNPLHGICVTYDQTDITKIHALVTGPDGTPYEGGLFHFFLRCPPDYPNHPPRVKVRA